MDIGAPSDRFADSAAAGQVPVGIPDNGHGGTEDARRVCSRGISFYIDDLGPVVTRVGLGEGAGIELLICRLEPLRFSRRRFVGERVLADVVE
jgi:hypothetical protein